MKPLVAWGGNLLRRSLILYVGLFYPVSATILQYLFLFYSEVNRSVPIDVLSVLYFSEI